MSTATSKWVYPVAVGDYAEHPQPDKREAWAWMKSNSPDMVAFVTEFKSEFPEMALVGFEVMG